MKFIINDSQEIFLSEEQERKLLAGFHAKGLQEYEKQGLELQLILDGLARFLLSKIEKALRKIMTKDEAKAQTRPPKGTDPAVHLSAFLATKAGEALRHAIVTISTNESGQATNFEVRIADKSGGQMDTHGNERQREDNRAEVSGLGVRSAFSDFSPLCPGYENGRRF